MKICLTQTFFFQVSVLVTLQPFTKLELLSCHFSNSFNDEEIEAYNQVSAFSFGYLNSGWEGPSARFVFVDPT